MGRKRFANWHDRWAGVGSVSLIFLTAAAAGLGLPRVFWFVMLAIAFVLGIFAITGGVIAHHKRKAREKALEQLRYLHLTGTASIAALFDVFRDEPSEAGLERAQRIVLTWVGSVIDALEIAAPHKTFGLVNAIPVAGAPPPYRGLTRDQSAQVEMLLQQVEKLGLIIEAISGELRA